MSKIIQWLDTSNTPLAILGRIFLFGILFLVCIKIQNIIRKRKANKKAAEEAAKQAESEPQKPQHFMTQMEYDQYKREHGIK